MNAVESGEMEPPIDVLGRVAALLRVVANSEPQGIRTSGAADACGLARPTVHRLLTAMCREGFVDRSDSGLWYGRVAGANRLDV